MMIHRQKRNRAIATVRAQEATNETMIGTQEKGIGTEGKLPTVFRLKELFSLVLAATLVMAIATSLRDAMGTITPTILALVMNPHEFVAQRNTMIIGMALIFQFPNMFGAINLQQIFVSQIRRVIQIRDL